MPDTLTTNLITEREKLVQLAESTKAAAAQAGRDLSAQDNETLNMVFARLEQIDPQLDMLSRELQLDEAAQSRLARLSPDSVAAPPQAYRTAGELVWDLLHRGQDRDAAMRYEKALSRAAQHMGTVAADTTATAGDLAGLVVDPVVGPVVNFKDTSRPFLDFIGPQQVAAYDFRRPYLTDTVLTTPAAAQTAQKAELPSTAFSVSSDTLEYVTYGHYLNVSQQLMSFQPGALQTIINELRSRVAIAAEKAALTELAQSTTKVTLATTATADVVLKAIYDGNAKVYDETGMPATWIAIGPTGLSRLGSLVDAALRPFFPTLGAGNAAGTASAGGMGSIAGIPVIQTYAITDVNIWMGNAGAFEAYEFPFPIMTQAEPSVLGTQVAVAAAYAFYRPRSKSGQLGATHLAP